MAIVKPSLNIGIEEEYQTIDPETRDLRSHIHAEIVEKGRTILAERVKPEMHQSVIEIGTGVCPTIGRAREEMRDIRRQIIGLAKANAWRWRPRPPIRLRNGSARRSIPTSAIRRLLRT
jgi:glutamate---cysteine ligase / carboxylate-amine ligase